MKYKNLTALFIATSLSAITITSIMAYAKPPSDVAVTRAVTANIGASSPATNPDNVIHVNTSRGMVSLTGHVMTEQDVMTALEKTEATPGVVNVTSHLAVEKGHQPMADSIITAKVKGWFARNKVFAKRDLSLVGTDVETKNGVVYLTGVVYNQAEANNAVRLANQVDGVRKVVDQLQVKP